MLLHGFLGNALLAGSCIAVASGLIGYFVVLRVQVFAGDALSHVAFTGALAAAAAGLDLRLGLFVATVAVALLLGALERPARVPAPHAPADDVSTGMVFVWVLGVGVLFLDLFNAGGSGSNGTIAARTLFGSIFSLTAGEAQLAAAIAAGIVAGLAAAAGVPVRALGFAFLALLGLDAAEATQAVGALLLIGLLAAPAGTAQRLTASPYRGLALSAAIALGATWSGLALSYWIGALPPGSAITLVAVGFYALVVGSSRVRAHLPWGPQAGAADTIER
jgi:zinc/manganese transport system permease protein